MKFEWDESPPMSTCHLATKKGRVQVGFAYVRPDGSAAFQRRDGSKSVLAHNIEVARRAVEKSVYGIVSFDEENDELLCEHCRQPVWDDRGIDFDHIDCEALAAAEYVRR